VPEGPARVQHVGDIPVAFVVLEGLPVPAGQGDVLPPDLAGTIPLFFTAGPASWDIRNRRKSVVSIIWGAMRVPSNAV
jgi:hypothetical protein